MDEDLKSLIKQYISEALNEIFHDDDEGDQPNRKTPYIIVPRDYVEYWSYHRSRRFDTQLDRLSNFVSKLESWAPSSGCSYNSSEIADIKRVLYFIDKKVP